MFDFETECEPKTEFMSVDDAQERSHARGTEICN